MPSTLRVANWERWQSYRKDRSQPPWIKLHRLVLRNEDWLELTDAEKGQLVSIWVLAAEKNGELPESSRLIQKACGLDSPPDIKRFCELGFLVASRRQPSDANATPTRRQRDAPEEKREEETRREERQTQIARAREDREIPHVEDGEPGTGERFLARFEDGADFDRFKAAYPKRAGSQPWRRAMDAATARAKEGHDFDAMIAGAERYARFCGAAGETGTRFVMQAATFLGRECHFLEPWEPPKKPETTHERMMRIADEVDGRYNNGRTENQTSVGADVGALRPPMDEPIS